MKSKNTQDDFDVHIYNRFGDIYTLSVGGSCICVDMPLDKAMEYLKDYLKKQEYEE